MIPVNINFSGISDRDTLTTYCDSKEIPDWLKEAPASLMKANDLCNGPLKVQKEIRLTNGDACWLYGYTKLYEVIFSAQDECNNRSEYKLYIRVLDTIAPVVQYLEEVICQDSKVIPPVVTDNCSEIIYNYSDAPVGGICGSNTSYIRTWSFSDACGNTSYATQYVVANDHKAPQMQLIAGPYKGASNNETIRVDCADFVVPDQATISSWMSVADECDIFKLQTKVDVTLGDFRRDGFMKRALLSWAATDNCGNSEAFTLTILLTDIKKPYFLPNATEVKAECENNIPAVRAYDDCSAVKVNVTRTKIPGSCPGNFTLVEKYTAEDACGNTADFSRRVYVEDKTGPVIFAPDVICEGDSSGYTPYAADYCNNEPVKLSITKGIKTYKCDGGYYYEVYYSAQDACGNSSVKTQRVVVDDHQPPVIVFTDEFKNKYKFDPWNASIEVSCEEYDSLVSAISKDTYIGIKDNCSSEVNIRTEEKSLGTHCDSEFLYKDYLFVWYATDICGNTSSMELKVKMKNNKTPDFSFVPADTTVYCLSEVSEIDLPELKCGFSAIKFKKQNSTPDFYGNYTETRTWTITNECNEQFSKSQQIRHLAKSDLSCTIIAPPIVYCNTSDNEFNVEVFGGTGPYQYRWEVLNGSCHLLSGQGTPTVKISTTFTTTELKVIITDANECITVCNINMDCSIRDIESIVTDDSGANQSGISLQNLKSEYQLRPNPTRAQVFLDYYVETAGSLQVNIVDGLGKLVYDKKFSASKGYNSETLSTDHLKSGIYLVTIINADKIRTLQLVKVN